MSETGGRDGPVVAAQHLDRAREEGYGADIDLALEILAAYVDRTRAEEWLDDRLGKVSDEYLRAGDFEPESVDADREIRARRAALANIVSVLLGWDAGNRGGNR